MRMEGSRAGAARSASGCAGITYRVVVDNDFRIRNAHHNNYWPTFYLIDKKGQIRYSQIGEGAYEATEQTII